MPADPVFEEMVERAVARAVADLEAEGFDAAGRADIRKHLSSAADYLGVPELLERLERYEEALRFYADRENWRHPPPGVTGPALRPAPTGRDRGTRARAALPSSENSNDDGRIDDGRE